MNKITRKAYEAPALFEVGLDSDICILLQSYIGPIKPGGSGDISGGDDLLPGGGSAGEGGEGTTWPDIPDDGL